MTDGRAIREATVPDTIGDAVLARVARLSDEARLVARAGAVVGRCFSPDVIAGMVDRPLGEVELVLGELIDAAVIYPFDYIDEGYYDFRHQLLRDAVYGSVPPSQLRRFHAQAAEFVMSLEAASIVHASRHFERAGLRPQAFRSALTAAEAASRISARHEAYELYRRAIDNMPADLPAGEQGELYERFSDAAAAIERNEESVVAATRARELYQEAGRPLDAAGMLAALANTAARGGSPHDETCAATDADRGCRRGALGSLDVIGLVALGRGLPDEARRWFEESLASGRQIGEVQFILTPLWGLAEADLLSGDIEGAIARCEEGWSIAASSGERALFIPFVVTGTRATSPRADRATLSVGWRAFATISPVGSRSRGQPCVTAMGCFGWREDRSPQPAKRWSAPCAVGRSGGACGSPRPLGSTWPSAWPGCTARATPQRSWQASVGPPRPSGARRWSRGPKRSPRRGAAAVSARNPGGRSPCGSSRSRASLRTA